MRLLVPFLFSLTLAAPIVSQTSRCEFKPYDKGCGPRLSGTEQRANARHTITIKMSRGLRDEMAILVIGATRTKVPIPVYGCFLLTDPAAILSFRTNAAGFGSVTLPVPPRYEARIFMQGASFSLRTIQVFASDGLEVRCRL